MESQEKKKKEYDDFFENKAVYSEYPDKKWWEKDDDFFENKTVVAKDPDRSWWDA